jgi:hypothetical protein
MAQRGSFYEVWEEVRLSDGEIIYKYVDTYKDPTLAIELCRWHSRYRIKELRGENDGRKRL